MYCRKCGAQIPDDSLFCPKCGTPQNVELTKKPMDQSSNSGEREILKEMKCPNCGAPLNPLAGEEMVVCQYCGTSISLSSEGWSKVKSHFILDIRVQLKDQALAIARNFLDKSILHRHLYEKSRLDQLGLAYIPYWIIDAGYTAQFKYKKMEAQPGGFVAMNLGGRGGFIGPTENFQTVIESGTDVGMVQYPVIAVENLKQYQPPDYIFNLQNKRVIGNSDINSPVKLLNGTIGEEKARVMGRVLIQQWEMRKLQKIYHHNFLAAETSVDISDVYLVHIPIWTAVFVHKDEKIVLMIDAHNAMVMEELKE